MIDSAISKKINSHLPSEKSEEWKYTNLRDYSLDRFKPITPKLKLAKNIDDQISKSKQETQDRLKENSHEYFQNAKYKIVFVNGVFLEEFSTVGKKHVKLSLNDLDYKNNQHNDMGLAILNKEYSSYKLKLTIDDSLKADAASESIYIINILTSNFDDLSIQPSIDIELLDGVNASIVEAYFIDGKKSGMINGISNILLNKNSTLNHSIIMDSKTYSLNIVQSKISCLESSNFRGSIFAFGGKLSRITQDVHLDGLNATANVKGLNFGKDKQRRDINLKVWHNKPKCKSNTLIRGVLDDASKGSLTGTIIVAKNAVKSDAFLENKNILLTAQSVANSRPQLEIYNDDVVCSHGSATGFLDDEELFYLRSRGISLIDAKNMLVEGFIVPSLANVSCKLLKDKLSNYLRLGNNL